MIRQIFKQLFITFFSFAFFSLAFAFLNPIQAQVIPASTNPRLCEQRGLTGYTFTPGYIQPATIGVCSQPGKETVVCSDKFFQCKFEGWRAYCMGNIQGCCPANWLAKRSSGVGAGGKVFCCPPTHPNQDSDALTDYCFDTNGFQWSGGKTGLLSDPNYGLDTSVLPPGATTFQDLGNSNDQILEATRTEFIDDVTATGINGAYIYNYDKDVYGCFDPNYYCAFGGDTNLFRKGPSFIWPADLAVYDPAKLTLAEIFISNLESFNFAGKCQRTCSSNQVTLEGRPYICLPQLGFVESTASSIPNFVDPAGATQTGKSAQEAYDILCKDPGEFIPSGAPDDYQRGCGRIIYDPNTNTISNDPVKQAEYAQCVSCEGTTGSYTGSVWTEIGCVEPTLSGIITRIFQIGVGIIGAVIIIRIFQIVAILNNPEAGPDAMTEVREIIFSIVSFVVVTLGAVAILRFLGFNVLGIDLPIFNP